MMPVVKLKMKSHALISLYQLYSHTWWIPGKLYRKLYNSLMWKYVADLRTVYLSLTGRIDNVVQA
jgi:hypothetical protein